MRIFLGSTDAAWRILQQPHFHPDSYGYQPGKSAHQAIGEARKRCWRYDWVVGLDIKGFFDTIFTEVRSWKLHLRSDKSLEDLAGMFNAKIRGWINYYGAFYRSALNKILWKIDCRVVRGAMRKYKRLRNHKRLAVHWLKRSACKHPVLFAHWQNVIPKTRAV
jgi:hypothetical protein